MTKKAQSPFGSKPTAPTMFRDVVQEESRVLRPKADQLPATQSSPFSKRTPTVPMAREIMLPVSDADIDKLGSDMPQRVSSTVNSITAKVSTAQFGELGDLLAEMTVNADMLDPNNYAKAKGLFSWFRNAVVDVRKVMIKNLTSAQSSFDSLETKMTEQMQIHRQWIADLQSMYKENEQNYFAVVEDIAKADSWAGEIRRVIQMQPAIDPTSETAMMQANMVRKAESTLNRASHKADTFRRSKVLIENIAPKIMAQISASENTIRTYEDLIQQVIPIVKMEFALYIHALSVNKDNALQENIKSVSEKAITSSAETSATAIVNASTTANSALISNDALNKTRSAILGAITRVREIESGAQQQRLVDAQTMQDNQAAYLQQLQNHGAV